MAATFHLTEDEVATYTDNLQPQLYAGLSICTSFVVLLFAFRIWAQAVARTLLTADMCLITIAFVFTIGLNATVFVALNLGGGGKHAWRVIIDDNFSANALIIYQKTGFWVGLLVPPTTVFIKLSILAFLRRVFTTSNKIFRVAWWTLLVLHVAYLISFFFVLLFSCSPVSWFWDRVLLEYAELTNAQLPSEFVGGTCLPIRVETGVPLATGMAMDIAVLILPLAPLWKLQLVTIRKVGVFSALSIGLFAIALNGVRLYYLFQVVDVLDATWVNTPVLLWSSIEGSAGFVCACIPACAPLVRTKLVRQERTQSPQFSMSTFKSQSKYNTERGADENSSSMQSLYTSNQNGSSGWPSGSEHVSTLNGRIQVTSDIEISRSEIV